MLNGSRGPYFTQLMGLTRILILFLLFLPIIGFEASRVMADTDITHADGTWVDVHQVIDLKVSSKNVGEGDTLTVTATCKRTSQYGAYIQDFQIMIKWGEIEVISYDPPSSESHFLSQIYGTTSFNWQGPLDSTTGKYAWSSPATFTVTVRLLKPRPIDPMDNAPMKPRVIARFLLHTEPESYTEIYLNRVNSDDISLLESQLVQVVLNPKAVVAGKKAAVYTRILSTYKSDVRADISITYDFGEKTIVERGANGTGVLIKPGENHVYLPGGPNLSVSQDPWQAPYKGDFLYWSKSGDDSAISVTLDPQNKLTESNEGNNQLTITKKVIESKTLKILNVPVYFPESHDKRFNKTIVILPDSKPETDLLEQIFPVAEDKIEWTSLDPVAWQGKPESFKDYNDMEYWMYMNITRQYSLLARALGYDRLIMTIRGAESCAIGVFLDPSDIISIHANWNRGTIAHEMAHTFYLWHPHDIGPPVYLAERYCVDTREYGGKARNIMAYGPDPSGDLTRDKFIKLPLWLDEGRYQSITKKPITIKELIWGDEVKTYNLYFWNLLEQFQKGEDPPIVIVRGVVEADGSISTEPWYRVEGYGDIELNRSGDYSIVYLDGGGSPMSRYSFNASFTYLRDNNGTLTEVTRSRIPFIFNLPYEEGASSIEIRDSTGKTLVSQKISVNKPSVKLISPNGGEIYKPKENVTIKWQSSDEDGDHLTYLVSYSSNGGVDWIPLASDLSDNYLTWSTPEAETSKYLIKVIVTDGLNTGEDTSNSAFTVKQFEDQVGSTSTAIPIPLIYSVYGLIIAATFLYVGHRRRRDI